MNRTFPATRAAGLVRLADITPRMGRTYAAGRNTDHGPETETATSALSPYLRRRMVLESEAVEAALAAHGPTGADKYVQEVFWRSYFKGHLETRPALWTDYQRLVVQGRNRLATEAGLRRVFHDAVAGHTGIDGFDDWSRELAETNWLHNHARMWFASIWIFTLRLPWALGRRAAHARQGLRRPGREHPPLHQWPLCPGRPGRGPGGPGGAGACRRHPSAAR